MLLDILLGRNVLFLPTMTLRLKGFSNLPKDPLLAKAWHSDTTPQIPKPKYFPQCWGVCRETAHYPREEVPDLSLFPTET